MTKEDAQRLIDSVIAQIHAAGYSIWNNSCGKARIRHVDICESGPRGDEWPI